MKKEMSSMNKANTKSTISASDISVQARFSTGLISLKKWLITWGPQNFN